MFVVPHCSMLELERERESKREREREKCLDFQMWIES